LLPDSIKRYHHLLGQMITRLQGLTVWGAVRIKLVRRLGLTEGREDDSLVLFSDTDTTLDIYLPINFEEETVLLNCLSQQFIKHCSITDDRYRGLVRPILDSTISYINTLFEELCVDYVGGTHPNRGPIDMLDQPTLGVTQPARGAATDPAVRRTIFESTTSNG